MSATSSADGGKRHAVTETHQWLPACVCSNAIMRVATRSVQNISTNSVLSSEIQRGQTENHHKDGRNGLQIIVLIKDTMNRDETKVIIENTEHNSL